MRGEVNRLWFPPVTGVFEALTEALEVPANPYEGVAGREQKSSGHEKEKRKTNFHKGEYSGYFIISKSVM